MIRAKVLPVPWQQRLVQDYKIYLPPNILLINARSALLFKNKLHN